MASSTVSSTARSTRGPSTAFVATMAVAITAMVPTGWARRSLLPLSTGFPAFERFQSIVRNGTNVGGSVMKGFAGDANIDPYIQDIYAYLQARADGALGRGRPARLEP